MAAGTAVVWPHVLGKQQSRPSAPRWPRLCTRRAAAAFDLGSVPKGAIHPGCGVGSTGEKNIILRQGNLPLAQHTAKQRQAAGAPLPFTPIALTHFYDSLAKHRFSIPQEIPALKNSSQAKFRFLFFFFSSGNFTEGRSCSSRALGSGSGTLKPQSILTSQHPNPAVPRQCPSPFGCRRQTRALQPGFAI